MGVIFVTILELSIRCAIIYVCEICETLCKNCNILSSQPNSEERSCNCRNKDNFPLAVSCFKLCIVYRADVIKQNETHTYYSASDREFKYRYNKHTNSLRNQHYENKTELSKFIWQLKRNGTESNLKWNIAPYGTPYRCGTRRCDLCLTENTSKHELTKITS